MIDSFPLTEWMRRSVLCSFTSGQFKGKPPSVATAGNSGFPYSLFLFFLFCFFLVACVTGWVPVKLFVFLRWTWSSMKEWWRTLINITACASLRNQSSFFEQRVIHVVQGETCSLVLPEVPWYFRSKLYPIFERESRSAVFQPIVILTIVILVFLVPMLQSDSSQSLLVLVILFF